MSLLGGDPLTQLAFSIYENKGVFALLLGSGLSRSASIPTGWEITLDLIRRVALAQGTKEQQDWAKWYRDKTANEPNYSALLEELAFSPDERRSILHRYIEPTEDDRKENRKIPTPAHRAIAELVSASYIRVIITTNFDRLMENALRERGLEPTIIASLDALSGAEPFAHSVCYIVKMHGDYKDARILNTDAELNDYPAQYNILLDRIFDEHGLIICGWSGEWDRALRAAFLRAPNRRYPVYWATRGNLAEPAQEVADHRKAKIIRITDANSFFTGLRERVETLSQTQRQNPLSIDVLVNSTKRYLAKLEYRIQLDELVTQETSKLLTRLDNDDFAPQAPWNQASFCARVRKYESVTEPLARMAGVMGRWGDDGEIPVVLDIIRSLYRNAEKVGNGLEFYLNVRSYPAVLIFTAYGLGLVRAERWGALRQLFSGIIAREYKEPVRVIETLFLTSWKGTDGDLWNQIEGLEQRKTPLSDHLLELLFDWGKSFVGLAPDFELMYERFEMLGSLSHLERNEKEALKNELSGDPRQSWGFMPVGRAGWHSTNAEKLVAEIQSDPLKSGLIKAGFAKADPEYLEMFITNFKRIANRMRW